MVKLSANFHGVMDRDSDDRYVEKGNYLTLKNGIIDRDNDGGRYLVKNLRSSKFVADIPTQGNFVGAKEYKGLFYQFYYDSTTNELSLYQVNPSNTNGYTKLFQKELRDLITQEIPGNPGSVTSSGKNFYNNFMFADSLYQNIYLYNKLEIKGGLTVNPSETAGTQFTDEADVNNYFKIANEGTPNEYVICNVPIVSQGEIEGPRESTITTSDFSSFSDFQQYVTVKNKGGVDEYIVMTLPFIVESDITIFSTESFAAAENFTFEDIIEEPTDPTTVIIEDAEYGPVNKILSIDIVENQINGDLLCYWTDGINPPFKVNISWLLRDNQYYYVRDMFVAKIVPKEPSIIPYHDYSYSGVNNRDSIFQFATRYVYNDGEKTPLSTYSKAAFYPQLDGVSEVVGGVNGYYVDAGTLYRISGFDNSSPQPISSDHDTGYDRVMISDDGSVMVMYSSTTILPIKRSLNKGITFSEATGEGSSKEISSADMSSDGQYIYMLASGGTVWRSTDYGTTFVVTPRANGDIEGKVSCSRDGKYIAVYELFSETLDPTTSLIINRIYHIRILPDYGESEILTVFQNSMTGSSSSPISDPSLFLNGTISSNGRYFAFSDTNIDNLSQNYIKVYDIFNDTLLNQSNVGTVVNTVAVLENGTGWADGYKTSDFFATYESFDNLDQIWLLNRGFIGVFGTTYTRYNEFSVAEDSGTLSVTPSYISGVSASQAIKNITNFYNTIDVWVHKPNQYVDTVEVYAIDTSDGTTYLIKELENTADNFPVDEFGTYITFRNNLIYRVLSETEKSVLFSNVPLKATHQAFIGNRLIYANYYDGRTLPVLDVSVSVQTNGIESNVISSAIQADTTKVLFTLPDTTEIKYGSSFVVVFAYNDASGNIKTQQFKHVFANAYNTFGGEDFIDIDVELQQTFQSLFVSGVVTASHDDTAGEFYILLETGDVNTTFTTIYESNIVDNIMTWRKGRHQQLGIVYYDNYNRGSYPIFGGMNAIIPDNISDPWASIIVDINHTPPSWARRYKFVRTDRDLYYRIIPGFRYAKAQSGYIYLMKQEGENYIPDAGVTLEVHDRNGDLHRMPVVSKEVKDADFVTGSPAGEWISIKDPQIEGLSADSVLSGASLYSTSSFYAVEQLETADELLYYEIPGVFEIIEGKHQGNVRNQDTLSAQIRIDGANVAYIPDVNIEVNFTSDGGRFWNGGRALIKTEQAGEIHRYSSLTWSDTFVQETGYNGLSMFNQGVINWKGLDAANGPINAILAIETNLYIWQEDKIGYVLINKNAITTALGEDAITSANQVAGEFVPYTGKYGTLHPESIAVYGGMRYFVDVKRDAICRISQDGITELHGKFMASVFHELLDKDDIYIGAFNIDHKEYWLYSANNNIVYVYDEKAGGWTRYITPITLEAFLTSEKLVYTLNDTLIYSQMNGDGYGNINGTQLGFEFEYVQNEEPGMVKVWNTSEVEANKPIQTAFTIGGSYNSGESFNTSSIPAASYEHREGEYFAYIPRAYNVDISEYGLTLSDGGVIIPVGEVESVSGNSMTLKRSFFEPIGEVKHTVFVIDDDGSPLFRGFVADEIDINGKIISTTGSFNSSDVGRVAFLVENSYINGHQMRSPFIRVKFTDGGSEKVAIFASRLEVIESKNQ